MKEICHTSHLIAILMTMTLALMSYGNAATVREVTMTEMLQMCQLVFEGKVISIEAKEDDRNRIHTFVTFKLQEIIKGEHPNSTITLSFLGGTVGDVTMMVGDMKFPEVGEHGIYFVESMRRPQVNPLYGWSQGHFLVETDETGTERVLTRSRQPVTEVRSNTEITATQVPTGLSTGVARGLTLGQEQRNKGLTLVEFKKVLHERLSEIQ
ncbi:hypothetical protein [Desulfocastanea catecholica]